MKLISACTDILDQLASLVDQIDETDFYKPSPALSGSTIGQHLRHTLEFFLCLESGFTSGIINYDKRNHDKLIETDKSRAKSTIFRIKQFLTSMDLTRALKLEVNYNVEKEENVVLETSSARELVYNIEHAVHHMALIKIGVREIAPYISIDKSFGVAASTIRYQENIAVASV